MIKVCLNCRIWRINIYYFYPSYGISLDPKENMISVKFVFDREPLGFILTTCLPVKFTLELP